jgi:hypothetical protein
MNLAHGIGSRADLPVPTGPAVAAAATVLVLTFVVLTLFRRTPPPPRPQREVRDSPVLQALALVVLVGVVVIGFAGPAEIADNLAPWAFYLAFWVGLVPLSLLFGPVVRIVNPLRLLHVLVAGTLRIDVDGVRPLPARLGYWPAVVSLAGFGWLELVFPERAEPVTVAVVITAYAVVHTAAAVVFGREWFDRGDGFEVYSSLLGALTPFRRLRAPRAVPAPGLTAVLVVLVGATAYDGLSRTRVWTGAVPADVLSSTLGLLGATLAVGVVFLLGAWVLTRHGSAAEFATTLTPIAAGYAIAHYFSLLVLDGQRIGILLSDPFGTGADLLGTADATVDYRLVGPVTIMAVQLGAIVLGHIVATVDAHDRALRRHPPALAARTQYPMLAAMVALTVGAVGLLFAA